jgi:hypothetical protein
MRAMDDGIVIPRTPLLAGESQGGISITLATRTPQRLRGPLYLFPQVASEPDSVHQGLAKELPKLS